MNDLEEFVSSYLVISRQPLVKPCRHNSPLTASFWREEVYLTHTGTELGIQTNTTKRSDLTRRVYLKWLPKQAGSDCSAYEDAKRLTIHTSGHIIGVKYAESARTCKYSLRSYKGTNAHVKREWIQDSSWETAYDYGEPANLRGLWLDVHKIGISIATQGI